MATFIADYLNTVDLQWKEIDILAQEAIRVEASNAELYNVLCRSITILIVAHMEGFIKGATKNIISDYASLEFKMLPTAVKITYCKRHLGFDEKVFSDYHSRIRNLISDLESSRDFKITHEAFTFDRNRNPKPATLESIASRFGVADIFKNLNDSLFDEVFSMTSSRIKRVLPIASKKVKKMVFDFPYKVSKHPYGTEPKKYTGRTLWQTFLDDLNMKRHTIAHGNDFNNTIDINTLIELKDKVMILQLSFLIIICSELCND